MPHVNNRVSISVKRLLRMIRKCDPVSVFLFFFVDQFYVVMHSDTQLLSSQPSRRGGWCRLHCRIMFRFVQIPAGKNGKSLPPLPLPPPPLPTYTYTTSQANPPSPNCHGLRCRSGPGSERFFFTLGHMIAHAVCCFVNTSGNCRTARCKPGGRRSEMVDVVTKNKSGSRADFTEDRHPFTLLSLTPDDVSHIYDK